MGAQVYRGLVCFIGASGLLYTLNPKPYTLKFKSHILNPKPLNLQP